MIQANETFNECIESSQEVTTQRVTTRSLTTPISFQSNRQLSPEENCKITSDELSIQCQLDCPCNQNCPSCSQPTDTCKVDYCPIVSLHFLLLAPINLYELRKLLQPHQQLNHGRQRLQVKSMILQQRMHHQACNCLLLVLFF